MTRQLSELSPSAFGDSVVDSMGYPFYYCIGVEKAVEEFFKNAYLPTTHYSKRVTSGEISRKQRKELIWRQHQEPHFGELLNATEKLLFPPSTDEE